MKFLLPFAAILLLAACTRSSPPPPPKTYGELVQVFQYAIKHKDVRTFLNQYKDYSPITSYLDKDFIIDFLEKNRAQIYVTDIYPFLNDKKILYPKAERFVWIIASDGDPEKAGTESVGIPLFAYTTNGIVKVRFADPTTDTSGNTRYEFTLVVKDKAKLLKNLGESHPHDFSNSWDGNLFHSCSMGDLAKTLWEYTGFRVTDQTGINGDYDFDPHIRNIHNPATARIDLQAFGLDLILKPTSPSVNSMPSSISAH